MSKHLSPENYDKPLEPYRVLADTVPVMMLDTRFILDLEYVDPFEKAKYIASRKDIARYLVDIVWEIPSLIKLMDHTCTGIVGLRATNYFHPIPLESDYRWEFLCSSHPSRYLTFIETMIEYGVKFMSAAPHCIRDNRDNSVLMDFLYMDGSIIDKKIRVYWAPDNTEETVGLLRFFENSMCRAVILACGAFCMDGLLLANGVNQKHNILPEKNSTDIDTIVRPDISIFDNRMCNVPVIPCTVYSTVSRNCNTLDDTRYIKYLAKSNSNRLFTELVIDFTKSVPTPYRIPKAGTFDDGYSSVGFSFHYKSRSKSMAIAEQFRSMRAMRWEHNDGTIRITNGNRLEMEISEYEKSLSPNSVYMLLKDSTPLEKATIKPQYFSFMQWEAIVAKCSRKEYSMIVPF